MVPTISLFKALKDALKINATSEESDHSLDYYCTCSTTLDNPFIRALVQNKVDFIAKNKCLEEGMNYLRTQLRKKQPPVAVLSRKSGNPFRNNQYGRKALSRDTNAILDTVASACFDKPI